MSKKQLLLWLAIGILLCLSFVVWQWPDDKLHLIFCDVGQGDGELLVWKNVQILIDGGPDEAKLEQCLSKHMPFWDRKVELIINTHPEEDHLGALHAVVQKYEAGAFLNNGFLASNQGFAKLVEALQRKHLRPRLVKQGDRIKLGSVVLEVLWPSQESLEQKALQLNKNSIVLRLQFGEFTALFTGDIGIEEELALMHSGLLDKAELLKIAHHGSKFSSSQTFVAKLRPKMAIFEVGAKNRFGHPNPEILTRFDLVRSKILRTDQNGTIEVVTDGAKWGVKTER